MSKALKLFQAFGVELEYMIVDSRSLNVLPISDFLLRTPEGQIESELNVNDRIAWSNELVLHVIELKTNGPKPSVMESLSAFNASIQVIEKKLEERGARLLPGGMHPWMNPDTETKLWPHEYNAVYESFDRIFNCRGHGWSNLQSSHLNIGFSSDEEFFALHEGIRFLLPLLPALTASSPFADARFQGALDYRLRVYQKNCAKIPSVTGKVIPESVKSMQAYQDRILKPMYADISDLDPEGILQYEWLNARGAIARFDRMAIEIRTIDNQETPLADLSICHSIEILLKDLVSRIRSKNIRHFADTDKAFQVFNQVLQDGGDVIINHELKDHLERMEISSHVGEKLMEVWARIFEDRVFLQLDEAVPEKEYLGYLLENGCLAQRILRRTGRDPSREKLFEVYQGLAECLKSAEIFE